MEIPMMIFNEVKRIETQTLRDEVITFHITFHFHDKREYKINVRPHPTSKNHNVILVEYKETFFQCDTKSQYTSIMSYLAKQIEREVYDAVGFDNTWNDYDESNEENFGWFTIDILKRDTIIFRQLYTNNNTQTLTDACIEHTQPFYHVYFPKLNYQKFT